MSTLRHILFCFLSLVCCSYAEKVTFVLYDNGASDGGVEVSFSPDDWSSLVLAPSSSYSGDANPNELFAMQMSKLIDVSKFGQEPGTVVATKAFREDGEKIVEFDQLRPSAANDDDKRRVYLVAEGLEFVWPFVRQGHNQTISTKVQPPVTEGGLPVVLESLSETPRVFKVYNLFTVDESNFLVENALNLTGDEALKRSTVGNRNMEHKGDEVFDRTSENAWDYSTPTAKTVISRSFNITGIVENAGQIDGLQVVRYKVGQGYNTHPDFFEGQDVEEDFNFLPYSGGSNRFATVFMYLSNVEEGGSTVFPYTPILPEPQPVPEKSWGMFPNDSWEAKLNHECYAKIGVEPKIGTAALFYSVKPDGQIDRKSYHGACPVLAGEKWGANIWIWNKQRYGDTKQGDPRTLMITNEILDEIVYLSWEGQPMGELQPGKSIRFISFEFHRFKAHFGSHENKEAFAEFAVASEPDDQVWNIQPPRPKSRIEQQQEVQEVVLTISNTLEKERVYLMWEGMNGSDLPAGQSITMYTFASHLFEAKLDSFESSLVVSRYTVRDSPKEQRWIIRNPGAIDEEL